MHNIKQVQTFLVQAGKDLGNYGPNHDGVDGSWGTLSIRALGEWQGAHGLPKTGAWDDPATQTAMFGNYAAQPVTPHASAPVVPLEWMPRAAMERIIVHWTAGAHKASRHDTEYYHILIEDDGQLIRGVPPITSNARPMKTNYAAHTLNCNTGSIGVSLCCMGGAIESPFDTGFAPMTRAQWDKLPFVLADLCARYSIAPTRDKVLSHAEVQSTLGIHQRGKWDISRLSFMPSIVGAHVIGDMFREATRKLL